MLSHPLQLSSRFGIGLASVFLLASASPAHAGPSQQAKKMLQASAKSVLKDFKKETKLHRKLLDVEIDAVDSALKNGSGGIGHVTTLFNALQTYQIAIRDEIRESSDEYRVGMGAALLVLQDASVPVSERPVGFFYGDGGASDDLRRDVERAIVKLYDSLEKRLRATAKLFRSKADIAFTYRLEAPTVYLEWNVGPGGSGSAYIPITQSIDIALAASALGVTGDGKIYLAGSGSDSDGSQTIGISMVGGGGILTNVTPTNDDRWTHVEANRTEGSYSFKFGHMSTSGSSAYVGIGVN